MTVEVIINDLTVCEDDVIGVVSAIRSLGFMGGDTVGAASLESGLRPYQCGHCSQSFSQPSELRNHVVTHSSDRPFKCGYCGRAFAGATTLNNHIRTHTGEKPFK
ncbi:hypothetical protein INR49_011520 [Caranx melampygus]|nr:hypothetical protein INR49_011520 [Caranx melampygus]